MTTIEAGPAARWLLKLQKTCNVESAELPPLVLLLICGFAKGLTFVYFETTANASFLAAYGPQLLPYVYVTVALVSTLMGFAITRLESRLSPPRFLSLTVLFLFGSIVAAYLLLKLVPARWPAFVLMVWKDVVFIIVELAFWALAGYLFNVRQGKRLFGLAGTGAIVAGIVGGLCAPLIIALLGKTQLLVVAAAGALVMLVTLRLITRRFPTRFMVDEDEHPDADWSLRALAGRPYVVLLAAFSVLSFFCYYTVDLAFYGEVERRWQDPAALASFFGIFYAALNTVMLLTSSFVVGRLILRFGLPIALLLVPFLEIGGTLTAVVAMVYAGGAMLAIMIVVKLLDEVTRATFEGTGYRVLYQAMPSGVRLRVQTIRESIVEPIAVGVSGLIFLAATEIIGLDSRELLLSLLVVVPLWIGVAVLLRRHYTTELGKTLAERNLDRGDLDLEDKSTRSALEKALAGHPHEALYAIDLLAEIPDQELPPYLGIAMENASAKVRAAALRQAAEHDVSTLAERAERHAVTDPEPSVRGAALEVLGILGPGRAEALAPRHIDAPEPEIRAGALAGMLKTSPRCAAEARQRLARLAGADDPSQRLFAAAVMATAAVRTTTALLKPLLADPDLEVRRTALRAATTLRDPSLLPALMKGLCDPQTYDDSQSALIAYRKTAVPILERTLTELYASPVDRGAALLRHGALLRIASRIGAPAVSLIYPYLDLYGADRRGQIIAALAYCKHSARGAERDRLFRQILLEANAIAWSRAALDDLSAPIAQMQTGGETAATADDAARSVLKPVLQAIETDIAVHRSNLILLLAPLVERERIISTHQRFHSSSTDLQAAALELLENLLPTELKIVVMPVLDNSGEIPPPPSQRLLRQPLSAPQRLAALAPGSLFSSPWTRAVVLFTMGRLRRPEAKPLVWEAVLDRAPIVREAALWCAARIGLSDEALHALTVPLRDEQNPALRKLIDTLLNGHTPESQAMYLTIEKVLMLKSVEIFSGIGEQQLIELATLIEERRFAPGQSIFHKDEEGDSMYVIVRGRVRIHIGDVELRVMEQGEVFGEMAVLDPEPRSASVTALDETQTFRITGSSISRLMEQHPPVARAIIRVLCRRQRANEARRFNPKPA